jgi:hypothetical protein
VTTLILAQIPDPHVPSAIATYQLSLVRMNNHIIHWHAMRIVPLHIAAPRVPDLDRAVFARGDQPFRLAVKSDAGDVTGVSVEGENRIGVGALDVVELDRVVPRRGKVALVGRDAEAVYLRVGVGDCAGADAGEGFPETARGQSRPIRMYRGADRMVWS